MTFLRLLRGDVSGSALLSARRGSPDDSHCIVMDVDGLLVIRHHAFADLMLAAGIEGWLGKPRTR